MIQEFKSREHVWVARIRNSVTFGAGSCSTVDECMTDGELLEFLTEDGGFEDFDSVWAMLVDLEEIHWERSGIPWEVSEETF